MSSTKVRRDTKAVILDRARDLFETQGYFATGLESVAAKAGVSRQAIYLHYSSKAELLRALHERVNQQDVAPAFEPVWDADDSVTALARWVDACGAAIPKILAIAVALDAARRYDVDAEATWQAPKEGQYAQCLRLATWLRRDGALVTGMSAREAADIIWTFTSLPGYEGLVRDRGWSAAKWRRWVHASLRQQLLAPAVSAPGRTAG